jgi:hypothetical protein
LIPIASDFKVNPRRSEHGNFKVCPLGGLEEKSITFEYGRKKKKKKKKNIN